MKALVYKDLLAVWNYCRTYLLMCAAFLLASAFVMQYSFLEMYPLIFVGMLINTLIAFDERDKWDRLLLTMPVTRKQYVTAKYLTGLILQGTVLVLTAAAHAIQLFLTVGFQWNVFWVDFSMLLLLAFAAPSVMPPLVFKYGSEKGRMAYLIIVGCVCGVVIAGLNIVNKLDLSQTLAELHFEPIVAVLGALIYLGSWRLSIHWYEKREF